MNWKAAFIIPTFVATVVTLGLWMENSNRFPELQGVRRSASAPKRALDKGPLAKLMRSKGMLHDAMEDGDREVVRISTDRLPLGDSTLLAKDFLYESWPVISIAVNDQNLNGVERGIFTNYLQRWEVPAHASYFEDGELIGEASCGIRLHGNSTRRPKVREKYGASVRLYFREAYGDQTLPLQHILGEGLAPDARLIVRAESPLSSALSFDIVRRIGGFAPRMRPALYVLNGEVQGMFSLSEHLTKDMWSHRLGHTDFTFYRNRGSKTLFDKFDFEAFHIWIRDLPEGQVTMERLSERVDLDNYLCHIFSILWCGTDDWAQGAAYLDRTESPQLWRWVNWDMDRSFRHSSANERGPTWNKVALGLILKNALDESATPEQIETNALQTSDVRGMIFAGLMRDDPTFPDWFARRAIGFMNHQINSGFLSERIAWYEQFRGSPGINPQTFALTKDFLEKRSEFFRGDLTRVFDLGESFPVDVTSPMDDVCIGGPILIVDGWPEALPYRGYYFPGQTIRIELAEPDSNTPPTWVLGDKSIEAQSLLYELSGPVEITLR